MLGFRARLTLAHQAAIVVVLTLAAAGGYWWLSRSVHAQLDAALLALAESELGMLQAGDGRTLRIHEVAPGPAPPSFERLDRLLQIVGAEGEVLARSANLGAARLPTSPALLGRLAQGEVVFDTLSGYGSEPTRMVSLPVRGPGPARAIQVAGSLDDVNHVVREASYLFVGTGLALLLAVGAAGAVLTRRAFGAIDDVVQQARRIGTVRGPGDSPLAKRLPHPGPRDEVGRLVETLNEMLGRIEHAFEAQRRFTADASHELRSPLSRLRTELELSLRRPREPADYVLTVRSGLEEVEHLTLLVEELLVLARLDVEPAPGEPAASSLHALAEEAVQRLEAAAREREITVELGGPASVGAAISRGASRLVLGNLLDNAIKFSPPGGRVSVAVSAEGEFAVVSVADGGPGIAVTELPYLFERFFRGSAARAGAASGVGLGLALSQAVVQAHGGTITAANRPGGGAVFTVRFRRADVAGDVAPKEPLA